MSYSYSYYYVENQNPVVGSVKPNGKQEIGVHDYKTGNRRYLEVDQNKVDTFINSRNDKIKKTRLIVSLGTIAATALGVLIGHKVPKSEKAASSIIGASLGLTSGLCSWRIAENSVDKSITQKFIDENK